MIYSITTARIATEQYATKKAKATIIVLRRWMKKISRSTVEIKRISIKTFDESSADDEDIKDKILVRMLIEDEEMKNIANENMENERRETIYSDISQHLTHHQLVNMSLVLGNMTTHHFKNRTGARERRGNRKKGLRDVVLTEIIGPLTHSCRKKQETL
ncbi:hypothetical protein PV325_011327 [Microctonus aethiopoides]|nr:hypothetical protein PV325_011327 [Microctonus aethiopoides]